MITRIYHINIRKLYTSSFKMPKRSNESPEKDSKKPKAILDRSPTPRIKTNLDNEIKIISANVAGLRGLLNSNDKKCKFLKLMNDENPDIIALQEHKLQETHVAAEGQNMKKLFPNYKQYWTCSTNKKGYSGVAILIRSNDPGNPNQKSVKDFFTKNKNGSKTENEGKYLNPINVHYGLGEENEKDVNLFSSTGDEYRLIREKLLPGWLMVVQLFVTLAFITSFIGQLVIVCLLLRVPLEWILRFEWHICGIALVCKGITGGNIEI